MLIHRVASIALRVSILVSLATLASAQTRTAIQLDPADIVNTFRDGNDRVIGWEFTVGPSPIRVTGLGVYDHDGDGLLSSYPVAIYRASDQAQIAIDLVEAGTIGPLRGAFRWEDTVPFELDAGETYVIATYIQGNEDLWIWDPVAFGIGIATSDLVLDPAITLSGIGGSRFICCAATGLEYPPNPDNNRQTFLGPNLEYEVIGGPAVPVGEWVVPGVLIGMIGLGVHASRNRAGGPIASA